MGQAVDLRQMEAMRKAQYEAALVNKRNAIFSMATQLVIESLLDITSLEPSKRVECYVNALKLAEEYYSVANDYLCDVQLDSVPTKEKTESADVPPPSSIMTGL